MSNLLSSQHGRQGVIDPGIGEDEAVDIAVEQSLDRLTLVVRGIAASGNYCIVPPLAGGPFYSFEHQRHHRIGQSRYHDAEHRGLPAAQARSEDITSVADLLRDLADPSCRRRLRRRHPLVQCAAHGRYAHSGAFRHVAQGHD